RQKIRARIVVENTADARGLLGELGFSVWLEFGKHSILFDTGQGMTLRHNAEQLKIPLETAETLVLSHGHYDHTGGLATILEKAPKIRLYAHPKALEPKYVVLRDSPVRENGISELNRSAIRKYHPEIIETIEPCEIFPGVWVTGEIPRIEPLETLAAPIYLDRQGTVPDTLADDQALFIDTPSGIVVVLGCAHAGVINTLNYIADFLGVSRIHAVFGGTHLLGASDERLNATLAAFEKYQLEKIMPLHCTGEKARFYFHEKLPHRYLSGQVGVSLEF
ncbi:MAG: MBL fold metallo-hydrolase, partial [Candidatus Zixiibacteriota bacterium]